MDTVLEWGCPECMEWFPEGEGLIPHVLTEHPFSTMAKAVDEALLDGILGRV